MKKIKLITPILGVTTIATSLIPLTSCNKNKGMSQEQWNKAFASIKDPWDTSRNFSIEGNEYIVDAKGQQLVFQGWTCKSAGKFNEGVQIDEDGDQHKYDSCLIDDIIWVNDNNTGIEPCIVTDYPSGNMIGAFVCFGEIFDSMYKNVIYQGDNKYQAQWIDLAYVKGTCDFVFDSQLRIKDIHAKLYYGPEIKDNNQIMGAKLSFKDYGSTKVSITESKFDVTGRVHTADFDGTSKFVINNLSGPLLEYDCVYKFNMPENLSVSGLNTISLTNHSVFDDEDLILNGETLIEGSDYERSSSVITLLNPLQKNDKLWISTKLTKNVDTTMTLSAVK